MPTPLPVREQTGPLALAPAWVRALVPAPGVLPLPLQG